MVDACALSYKFCLRVVATFQIQKATDHVLCITSEGAHEPHDQKAGEVVSTGWAIPRHGRHWVRVIHDQRVAILPVKGCRAFAGLRGVAPCI